MKTGLSLTPDHDKEHPMELNFEYILEQIEFSQFQQHLTVPKSAKEILVRLKMRNRKTFPFFYLINPPGGRVKAEKTSKVWA